MCQESYNFILGLSLPSADCGMELVWNVTIDDRSTTGDARLTQRETEPSSSLTV